MFEIILQWQTIASVAVTVVFLVCILSLLARLVSSRDPSRAVRGARVIAQSAFDGPVDDAPGGDARPVDFTPDSRIEVVSATSGDGVDFFRQRQRSHDIRDALDEQASWRSQARDADVDEGLADWMAVEQDRIQKLQEMQAAVVADGRAIVGGHTTSTGRVVETISEEVEAWDATSVQDNPELAAVYKEITEATQAAAKESEDLSYVINKLETSVEFISMEFNDAVAKWKTGEAHRSRTLEDLKQTFRLKTYSLDDAWGLVFRYPDWVAKERRKLFKYVERLGTPVAGTEHISTLLMRAERAEWQKGLNVDMNVIFLLKEVRNINKTLKDMESRLEVLHRACTKRSNQVIAPNWETGQQAAG